MTERNNCLVCGRPALESLTGGVLLGSTTKADKLHPFILNQCKACGHVQKAIDQSWRIVMENLYERHYEDARFIGRQVNFVEGRIVNRDSVVVQKISSLLNLPNEGALLDVGCGAGRFIAAFGLEKPNWRLAGYDVSALHEKQILDIPGAKLYWGPNGLNTITEKFDLITLNHVVEHLTEPVSVLRAAAALLNPDGRIIVRVPSFSAVNTDFYLLEHCSHFTTATLSHTLGLAGLRIVQEITDFSAIEIGVVAITQHQTLLPQYDTKEIEKNARLALAWAQSLPNFVRNRSAGRRIGLFGVGGAGIWLGVLLKGELAFFVDEDPGKQGNNFAGCPIIGMKEVPADAAIFMTFNNPMAAAALGERLKKTYPNHTILIPPPINLEKSRSQINPS